MSSREKLLKTYFDEFVQSNNLTEIKLSFDTLCDCADVNPSDDHPYFYRNLRNKLKGYWKAQTLFTKLDRKYNQKEYKKQLACNDINTLIIGSGPCGLRCAIELALLGARVVVLEKRNSFSRNNVLHLWPYVISDLNILGAKKFFGLFCSGSINHISIKRLQSILLKVALLFGVQLYINVSFQGVIPPQETRQAANTDCPVSADGDTEVSKNGGGSSWGSVRGGWRAKVDPDNHVVGEYTFDVLIGANGRSNLLDFKRKELRCRLAIAITANFVNHNTPEEAHVEEISGIVCIFNQQYFKTLYERTGIDLENIVYYKDETHYFVMTVKKHCLLTKGVLRRDHDRPEALLAADNVDQACLQDFCRQAASAATNYRLRNLTFSMTYRQQPDVSLFDFTHLSAADSACRILERAGYPLVQALVGDSLSEPFWPTGSGCALGFLSALDAGWMVRRLGVIRSAVQQGKLAPDRMLLLLLEAVAERENIYQRLSQTSPKNMPTDFQAYTLNPKTRYTPCRMKVFGIAQILHLYDTDRFAAKSELKTLLAAGPILGQMGSLLVTSTEPQTGLHAVHFREKCQRYTEREKMLRWFQIRLSQQAKKHSFQLPDFRSLLGLPLLCLVRKYSPDTGGPEPLDTDSSSEHLYKALSVLKKNFNIEAPSDLRLELEPPSRSANEEDDLVRFLSTVYEAFKPLRQDLPEPLPEKRVHHYSRKLNKRQSSSSQQPSSPAAVSPRSGFLQHTSYLAQQLQQQEPQQLPVKVRKSSISRFHCEDINEGLIQARKKEILNRYAQKSNHGDPEKPQKSISTTKISSLVDKVFPEVAASHKAKNGRNRELSITALSDDNCCFCRKKLDIKEKEKARNFSYSKRCCCRECCEELKLGIGNSTFVPSPNQDVLPKSETGDATNSRFSLLDSSVLKRDLSQLSPEEISYHVCKCLQDLRRVNDESDENYDGSSETCQGPVLPGLLGSMELGGLWSTKFEQTKVLDNCVSISRNRLLYKVLDRDNSTSEDGADERSASYYYCNFVASQTAALNAAAGDEDAVDGVKTTATGLTRHRPRPAPLLTENSVFSVQNDDIPASEPEEPVTMTTEKPVVKPTNLPSNSRHRDTEVLSDTITMTTSIGAISHTAPSTPVAGGPSTTIVAVVDDNVNTVTAMTTTAATSNKTQRHLAKFKFCSEPPKPVSINPKDFIGQMNLKKLLVVQLSHQLDSAEPVYPLENFMVSAKDHNNRAATNHTPILTSRTLVTSQSCRSSSLIVVAAASPGPARLKTTSIHSTGSLRPPQPPPLSSTNKNPDSSRFGMLLNMSEFKDIDSMSINTEDSSMLPVMAASTKILTAHQQLQTGEQRRIKLRATLESDLEEDDDSSDGNCSLYNPSFVAATTTTSVVPARVSSSSLSVESVREAVTTASEDNENDYREQLFLDELEDEDNNNGGRPVMRRRVEPDVVSLGSSFSVLRKRTSTKRRSLLRRPVDDDSAKRNSTETKSLIQTTSPPLDWELSQPAVSAVFADLATASPASINNNSTATDPRLRSISDIYKKLDSIEHSLDRLELRD